MLRSGKGEKCVFKSDSLVKNKKPPENHFEQAHQSDKNAQDMVLGWKKKYHGI